MGYKCKKDQARAGRKHYLANREKIKARAHEFTTFARERNREFKREYLRSHPCIDCGFDNIIALDFDHVKGAKKDNVSDLVRKGYSLDNIKKEIEKCVVRCSNCHRIKTYNEIIAV